MKKILFQLLWGKPQRGENIINRKPKRKTIMPTDKLSMRQWYLGGYSDFFHNPKKLQQ